MAGERIRVAIASDDGSTVGYGHFAHNRLFLVYDVGGGEARLVEVRRNPFGEAPLHGHPTHSGAPVDPELAGLHGIAKYSKLRELVLGDVNLLVASGGCPTSISYFMSEGVMVAFVEPGVPVEEVVEALKNAEPRDLGLEAGPQDDWAEE